VTCVLGLNAYHGDAAACLLRDGRVVAAVEEERLNRVKHWAGFPAAAIAWCLREGGIGLGDLAAVAINRDPGAQRWRKLGYLLRRRPSPRLVLQRLANRKRWSAIEDELAAAFPGQRLAAPPRFVEHHLAHLASAYLASPFERATAISIDGMGDFASAAWGLGDGGALALEGRVHFPHSLGLFYQAATQYLGFPHYGDEYKLMGLAAYGTPREAQAFERIVQLQDDGSFRLDLSFFRHHREAVAYEWRGGQPTVGALWTGAWEALLGPARRPDDPLEDRHRDLAAAVQRTYEDAAFHLIGTQLRRHGTRAVAISGGCGFNSVANGKLRRALPVDRVYVQAAAGDAGGALGAAYVAWRELAGAAKPPPLLEAGLGPGFTAAEMQQAIDAAQDALADEAIHPQRIDDEAALCQRIAQAIEAGAVVGWFQGRAEWGPRALGHRSILADPRRGDVKALLNAKIKRRESFRPFAPSVLAEQVGAWFEEDDAVPFMGQVFQIREEKRALIPAVTHVDGSGRLQSVARDASPLYHRLISAFFQRTGVPMLLNTSFNENEPIVCRPKEALDCFLRTRMDLLALGPFVLSRGD